MESVEVKKQHYEIICDLWRLLKQDIDRMAKGGEEVGSPDWLHAAVLRYNEVLVRSGNTPCYHFALDLCTAAMNELISLCDHHLVSRMK